METGGEMPFAREREDLRGGLGCGIATTYTEQEEDDKAERFHSCVFLLSFSGAKVSRKAVRAKE